MKNNKGFTLIELIVVFIIVSSFSLVIFGLVSASSGNNNISFGVNGFTETRCINGYTFVIGQDGTARQIMNEFGHGAKCS